MLMLFSSLQLSSKVSSLLLQNSELVEQASRESELESARAEIEVLQKNMTLQRQQSDSRAQLLEEEVKGSSALREENKSE